MKNISLYLKFAQNAHTMRQKIAVQLTDAALEIFQVEADRKKRSRKQILELILEREAQKLRAKLCKDSEKSS